MPSCPLKLVYSNPIWKSWNKRPARPPSNLSDCAGPVAALYVGIQELAQVSPEGLQCVSELVKALLNDARGFS